MVPPYIVKIFYLLISITVLSVFPKSHLEKEAQGVNFAFNLCTDFHQLSALYNREIKVTYVPILAFIY